MKGFVLKGTVTLWLVAVIAMFFTACAKKSESQPAVTITAESYAKILNGDLSDFAGTWENVYNEKRQLKADGFFTDGLTVSNFRKTDNGNGVYSWWIKIDEDERLGEMGEVIFLYPAGVELDIEGFSLEYSGEMGILLNDKTKDRIVVRPVPLYEALFYTAVYYREGQAPTVETLAAQRQEAASSNLHPEILTADISAFVGTWVTSQGQSMQIRANGMLAEIAGNKYIAYLADDFEADAYIIPKGIEFIHWTGAIQTDTTKDRVFIQYGSERTPTNDDVYYREEEAQTALEHEELRIGSSVSGTVGGDWKEKYNIKSLEAGYILLKIESDVEIYMEVYNGEQFIFSNMDDNDVIFKNVEITAQPNTVYLITVQSYVRDVKEAAFRITAHLSQ